MFKVLYFRKHKFCPEPSTAMFYHCIPWRWMAKHRGNIMHLSMFCPTTMNTGEAFSWLELFRFQYTMCQSVLFPPSCHTSSGHGGHAYKTGLFISKDLSSPTRIQLNSKATVHKVLVLYFHNALIGDPKEILH